MVHFNLNNGDCIEDLKTDTLNGLLFSLMSKLYFPFKSILSVKMELTTRIQDFLNIEKVSKELHQWLNVPDTEVITLLLVIDEFHKQITEQDYINLKKKQGIKKIYL